MKVVLGVVNVPYADSSYPKVGARKMGKNAAKGRRNKTRGKGSITTLEVAKILESQYKPLQNFFKANGQSIADDLAQGYSNALKAVLMGAPPNLDPSGSAMSKAETRWRQFLSSKGLDRMGVKGVPTKAALRGVSHRFKHPYAKRPSRPSFIDTGLYQASVRLWIKE